MKQRRFVDQVTVQVRAGKGGDGCCSFRREAMVDKGGPDGGDGGHGGNVIIIGDEHVASLERLFFEPIIRAEDGIAGRGQQMHGRNGRDILVKVPCGTEIHDADTGAFICDITTHGQEAVIAKGGRGGFGNTRFKSATNQTPENRTPGDPGQEFKLRIELKLLADVGLVGFPNAGKSQLLRCLSKARPKVASYPFTTINPIVGSIVYNDFSQIRVADIPGLIEGAHQGIGLGINFLKHIARSRMLLYVIDMAGTDGREPWQDYRALRRELRSYDKTLLKLPFVIVANKMDIADAEKKLRRFKREIKRDPIPISALGATGIDELKNALWDIIRPLPPDSTVAGNANNDIGDAMADYDDNAIIDAKKLASAKFLDIGTTGKTTRKRIRH